MSFMLKDNRIQFLQVDPTYLHYLQSFDNRVRQNDNRPVIGILIKDKFQEYVVPLTKQGANTKSGKKRHKEFSVLVKDSDNIVKGALLINNMIPVDSEKYNKYPINLRTLPLFQDELIYLRKKEVRNELFKKIEKTYNKRVNSNVIFYNTWCCDYLKLEIACKVYSPNYNREQIKEIVLGLEKNLDVTRYANPAIDESKMKEIRLELEKNFIFINGVKTKTIEAQFKDEIKLTLNEKIQLANKKIEANKSEQVLLKKDKVL